MVLDQDYMNLLDKFHEENKLEYPVLTKEQRKIKEEELMKKHRFT